MLTKYVHDGSLSGMLRKMLLHTIDIGHMASHSLTHSYTLDSDIDRKRRLLWRWRWRSGTTARWDHRGLDTTNSFYSKCNIYHVITFTPSHSGTKSNLVHPHFHLQILVMSKAVQISCLNLGWAEPENQLVPEVALRLCK